MDKVKIKDVILTPLKKIYHPKGDILHGIKKIDKGYLGFGEAYFSTINYNEIKGWNRHKRMTLNLVVPIGSVKFVIYDDRIGISKNNIFFEVFNSSILFSKKIPYHESIIKYLKFNFDMVSLISSTLIPIKFGTTINDLCIV